MSRSNVGNQCCQSIYWTRAFTGPDSAVKVEFLILGSGMCLQVGALLVRCSWHHIEIVVGESHNADNKSSPEKIITSTF